MAKQKGGRGRGKNNYFCIYRGDEFLAHGHIDELAYLFKVEINTIQKMASYHKAAKEYKPGKLIAIKVDPLTKEDLIIEHRKRGFDV